MDIVIPILVISVVFPIVLGMTVRGLPRPIIRLAVIGLILRICLALLFLIPAARIFHDDADGYEAMGLAMSQYWHGLAPPITPGVVVNYGYAYWCAVLMYVFGPFRLYPSLFNSLFGVCSAILLYRIGRRYFVESVARRAMVFVLFFPSLVLWSSVAVKDTLMVLLLVICMNCVLQLRNKLSILNCLIVTGALIAILTIRFYMFYMTGLAIALSLTVFAGRRMGKSLTNQFLLLGVLAIAFMFFGLRNETEHDLTFLTLERVAELRSGLGSGAHSAWMSDVDISTPAKAIAFMPLGVLFLLFSPFPWQMTGLRPLLTLPEMLVWWSMTFAWIRGFRFVLLSRSGHLTPLLVFATILTLAYSTVHGNAGAAFRQRSQIMIFLFLFAAIGQYLKKAAARGLPPDVVRADWRPPEGMVDRRSIQRLPASRRFR